MSDEPTPPAPGGESTGDAISVNRSTPAAEAAGKIVPPDEKPHWNNEQQRLSFGTASAKMFNNLRTENDQGVILAAFEEKQWPSRIRSPFEEGQWDSVRNFVYELNVKLLKHGIPLRFISKHRPEQSIAWERT